MNKFLKSKNGITLVALVVTIILLLILAGISIATLTGSGLFEKARLAEQESKNKQELENSILKDYENKISEYINTNKQDSIKPTEILKMTCGDFFETCTSYIDETWEIEVAKNDNIISWGIYTQGSSLVSNVTWTVVATLKEEYRPTKSIVVAGGNGGGNAVSMWEIKPDGTVNVYQGSGRSQQCNAYFIYSTQSVEVINMTYANLFETYTSYINGTDIIEVAKNDDFIDFWPITNSSTRIPNKTWTTLGVLKKEYRPIKNVMTIGTDASSKYVSWWEIKTDGTVTVYQSSGTSQRCNGRFMYSTQLTELLNMTYADLFETYDSSVDESVTIEVAKKNNILHFNLSEGAFQIPNNTWTTVGKLKKEYRPVKSMLVTGSNANVNCISLWDIYPDGTVKVYQSSGASQQCNVNLQYMIY